MTETKPYASGQVSTQPTSQLKSGFRLGPGLLVTAAFIGPGTVVTASKAGALYGTSLLWAIVFACLTTIIFQEMAARIGIVTGEGLGHTIGKVTNQPFVKVLVAALIVVAILVGNAAYQAGNLAGAAAGVSINVGDAISNKVLVGLIGVGVILIIVLNRFATLQQVLTGLVVIMSLLFLTAAVVNLPPVSEIFAGFVPQIPTGSLWLLIAVLGTTVVPYNLFLHASLAATLWKDCNTEQERRDAIRNSRWDTILSVSLGGLVTAAILLSGSSAFSEARVAGNAAEQFSGVPSIVDQLKPALGSLAPWLFGIGLFAAGLTSAITAPIAAAYAAAGCFGWSNELSSWRLKSVAALVCAIGMASVIALGKSPQEIIALAQVANGLLLPILAIFILVIANKKDLMFGHINAKAVNAIALILIVVILLLAARQLKGGLGL